MSEKFGQMVRRYREARRWTQEQLAEAADLDQTTVSNTEREKGAATVATVSKLARAFGADPREWATLAGIFPAPAEPPAPPTTDLADRAWDPQLVIAYVESHPDREFVRELLEMKSEITPEAYLQLCIDTLKVWSSSTSSTVRATLRAVGRHGTNGP